MEDKNKYENLVGQVLDFEVPKGLVKGIVTTADYLNKIVHIGVYLDSTKQLEKGSITQFGFERIKL